MRPRRDGFGRVCSKIDGQGLFVGTITMFAWYGWGKMLENLS